MESIDFTIDETDPEISRTSGNFSVLKAHGLLRRYINSSADPGSISQFAAEIHNMLSANDGGQDDGDDEKDGEKGAEKVSNPWWEHTMFAHTLVNFIGKIPHSHRAQDDIVRLLVRLKSSTKLNIPVHDEQYGWEFYVGLTYFFYWVFRERCCGSLFGPSTPEETRFINESAFLARLSGAQMYLDASSAIISLKETLETQYESENPHYSGFLASASMWFIYAGQWLFTEVVQSPCAISKSDEGAWSNGPHYTGSVQGLERWRFWRKALEDSQADTRVAPESRALAEKAMIFMDAVERLNA